MTKELDQLFDVAMDGMLVMLAIAVVGVIIVIAITIAVKKKEIEMRDKRRGGRRRRG